MLIIDKLSKRYKSKNQEKTALDEISLNLGDGVHALLGPNGAGKSTLMKIITCNLKPDGGMVKWSQGEQDSEMKSAIEGAIEIEQMGADYRALIGYAPQQQGLYEAFTGYRFLQYMAVLKNISKKDMHEEINRVAASVNLLNVLNQRIGAYSGGMKQRLLVAQALIGNPKLLIFDEPTVGLDPQERVRIREYIHNISEGKIVLIATHIVSDIESIADDIIIMKEGRIVEKDTRAKLCEKYKAENLESVYVSIFNKTQSAPDCEGQVIL